MQNIASLEHRMTELEEQASALVMPQAEKDKRANLIQQAMGNWLKTDFRKFCVSCERHGRKVKNAIFADVAHQTKKTEAEVKQYYKLFWARYKELVRLISTFDLPILAESCASLIYVLYFLFLGWVGKDNRKN